MKTKLNILVGVLLLGLCPGPLPIQAARDMWIRITGIDGESQDDTHRNEIDVLAWAWGMSAEPGGVVGGGSTTRPVNFKDLKLTKYVDKATPLLMLRTSDGQRIPEATLTFRRTGPSNEPLEYLVITMTDVIITSVSTGGSGVEDRMTEEVTLNFAKVQLQYTPEDPGTGLPGTPVNYNWDRELNRPF